MVKTRRHLISIYVIFLARENYKLVLKSFMMDVTPKAQATKAKLDKWIASK